MPSASKTIIIYSKYKYSGLGIAKVNTTCKSVDASTRSRFRTAVVKCQHINKTIPGGLTLNRSLFIS